VDAIVPAGEWHNPLVEAENRIQEALQSGGVSKLDLSGLNLTELPKSINQFTYLTQLDLSRNLLKKIPKELFNISNLMTLDFSQNQLTNVPKNIDQFTSTLRRRSLDYSSRRHRAFSKHDDSRSTSASEY
jgi:hypothetical protein